MEITPYIHRAEYYETDQMGIIHHSNYIRWMESARIDFMDKLGISYKRLEELGIMSPVISVRGDYRSPVSFDDMVEIKINIVKYNGIKLVVGYEMYNMNTGKIAFRGESTHCFTDKTMQFVNLRLKYPELDTLLDNYAKS